MAASSLNQIPLNGLPTGSPGAWMQTVTVSVPATGSALVPAGIWMMPSVTSVSVQVQSATAGTWVTVGAAATDVCGVFSDGTNVQLANAGASPASVILYGPNGGVPAAATFNH